MIKTDYLSAIFLFTYFNAFFFERKIEHKNNSQMLIFELKRDDD